MTTAEFLLLERVHKLLALAGSAEPHEAAAAARAAQRLVSEHRLDRWLKATTQARSEDPITDGRDAPLEVARRIRKWKRVLGGALAEANQGAAWVLEDGGRERLCVVGRARDRAMVQALYEGLVRRIEWCSATAGPDRSRRWHEAFRVGVVEGLVPRLSEAEADARADAAPGALVPIDAARAAQRAELERYSSAFFGPSRGGGLRVDARAYAAGRDHGERMPLPDDD